MPQLWHAWLLAARQKCCAGWLLVMVSPTGTSLQAACRLVSPSCRAYSLGHRHRHATPALLHCSHSTSKGGRNPAHTCMGVCRVWRQYSERAACPTTSLCLIPRRTSQRSPG
eukprot:2054254-Prymnesium_polylepis.1